MSDQDRERMLKWLREDFVPAHSRTTPSSVDNRVATALEYIAYHIGQISRAVNRDDKGRD